MFYQVKNHIILYALLAIIAAAHIFLLWHFGYSVSWSCAEGSICFLINYFAAYWMVNMMQHYTPTYARQIYILIWSIIPAISMGFILYFMMPYLFAGELNSIFSFHKSIVLRIFVDYLLFTGIGFYLNAYYIYQQQLKDKDSETSIKELAKDAELYKLRQQIQPHFLFNSLNSITALISLDPPKARKMIQQLSEFLRATLKKEEKELISLKDELYYIQVYLEIEKVRFGDRLFTVFNVSDEVMNAKVPNLILQPVLENAIKYGLYNNLGKVSIELNAYLDGDALIVMIQNPYDPQDYSHYKGTGFGLKSIQRRLQLVYGINTLLQIKKTNDIFTTILRIPQA
jgi:sensor histidine kinase YesM